MAGPLEAVGLSILGGIGTGVVGVVALALQQRYSANTSQISEVLRELECTVDACSTAAFSVWEATGGESPHDVIEVVSTLHDINVLTRFVTDKITNSRNIVTSALINYRNATSGGDFDVKGRVKDTDRRSEIRSAAIELKVAYRNVDYDRRRILLFGFG